MFLESPLLKVECEGKQANNTIAYVSDLARTVGSSTSPSKRHLSQAIAQPVCSNTSPDMLPTALRALRSRSAAASSRSFVRYTSTATTSNQVPANDPVKRDAKPNVSETNAMPTSSEGSFDKVLQESPETAEKLRVEQAPNYKGIWSRSQNPREVAMSGPRFEQSIMEDQVCRNPLERTL